jgi:hypothetical protein
LVTAAGGSPASVSYPDIASTGWSHSAETITTGNPFVSSAFSWSKGAPSSVVLYSITATDTAGDSGTYGPAFVDDPSPPSRGALTVNGTTATASGSTSTASGTGFAINSRTDYTDSTVGIASSVLTVQSETLSGNTCGAPGSGGPFTTPTPITATTQPSGILANYCYLYTLTGTNNVAGTTTVSTTVQP